MGKKFVDHLGPIFREEEIPDGHAAGLLHALEPDHREARAIHERRHALQIADADEVGARFDERDELLTLGLGYAFAHDVAHDLRRADDVAVVVAHGRNRERHPNPLPVGAQPLRLEMLDPLAGLEAGNDLVFLGDPLGRDHEGDMAANGLVGRIAEQVLGRVVPGLNDAVQRLADDRGVRRFDDRREQPGAE